MFLVGMMGVGKSTIGEALAARLACPFFDSDREIERRAGRTVAEIFAAEGEAGFRAREASTIEALASRTEGGVVVALGGGAVAQPGAIERLRRRGVLVFLEAPPSELARRIGADPGRPLLAGLDESGRAAKLAALLEERRPFYEQARIRVDATGPVDEVVDRILAALRGD